ncbi:hypothetical protein GPECTOR_21g674 [Gonium pectorale]|uniref:Uncharacterized protein n=1 Tax=Gonium pectorale TaxID=33097 RepID=A0A150GHY7_GONPE|nr:hypothetical protein GPECTOR_21g674 [Gonium pectorale]|eukprot:KXZ49448.1 hypothetical protein GPECTOR_21g674 [Gonium pectorale]
MGLPAISTGSFGQGVGHGAAGAAAAAVTAPGGGKNPAARARRTSLVVAVGGAGGGTTGPGGQSFLPPHAAPAAAPAASATTSPNGTGAGGGTSGGGTMPQLPNRGAGSHGDIGTLVAGRPGQRNSLPADLHGGSGARSPGPGSFPVPRMSYNGGYNGSGGGGGGGGPEVPHSPTPPGLLLQLADLHSPSSGGAASTLPGVNINVPLSGLDALATTGLGDAISQLRHIRMGGTGPPASTVTSVAPGKHRESKVEPGLAGVTPLQLLPVPLPPIENWQSSGKTVNEVDPCRGIRLVDAPLYVLPRPTAEVDLQAKMAAHQAAMRDLVRAEGAPMSEGEMEAVKLLGRLERSGARARNYAGEYGVAAPSEVEEATA